MVSQPPVTDIKNIQIDAMGTERHYYSYDDNFDLNTRSNSETNTNNFKKVRYFYNPSGYVVAEREYNMQSNYTRGTTIFLNNVDPTLISVLTKVKITGGNPILNGEYLIASKQYGFTS